MSKKGLGKGLQALIPNSLNTDDAIREIPLDQIVTNPQQPRRNFDPEKLQELAESIRLHGVVQPIVVRESGLHKFEIVAGERRFRASLAAGISAIPAVVKDYSDAEMAEIALIENIQREDLDPLEEANAYRTLIQEFGLTQEDLAKRLGKSRPFVANTLRLLSLPSQVQSYLSRGQLSVGHAKALLSLTEPSLVMLVAEKVVRSGMSVRETEVLVKSVLAKSGPQGESDDEDEIVEIATKETPDPLLSQIEDRLRGLLRTKVKIKSSGPKGKIEIEYYSKDELSQIVEVLLGELS